MHGETMKHFNTFNIT